MGETSIEWTDKVWNPVTGCSKVSQGCKNCYAERIFQRPYPGRDFTDVRTHEDRLDAPLHWRKPARIFVNSMSDLFHEKVPFEFIDKVYEVMRQCPQHTFQILTKRPERRLTYRHQRDLIPGSHWLSRGNVWEGVSVEDQKTADERIPLLLQTPAAVRWVSYEPALGPVDFCSWLTSTRQRDYMLDWIVCGGESGPGSRPFNISWARSVIAQCDATGVPCFVKQLGAFPVTELVVHDPPIDNEDGSTTLETARMLKLASRKGGDASEWPEDLRVRSYPA